jgi:hypothetical protein
MFDPPIWGFFVVIRSPRHEREHVTKLYTGPWHIARMGVIKNA